MSECNSGASSATGAMNLHIDTQDISIIVDAPGTQSGRNTMRSTVRVLDEIFFFMCLHVLVSGNEAILGNFFYGSTQCKDLLVSCWFVLLWN